MRLWHQSLHNDEYLQECIENLKEKGIEMDVAR